MRRINVAAIMMAVAGFGVGAVACSPDTVDNAPVFPGGSLNVIEQQEYPQDLATVLIASINALTVTGYTTFAGTNPVTSTSGCPMITPQPLVYENGAGIPDLDSAKYVGGSCTTALSDTSSLIYNGLIVLSDPTPTANNGSFNANVSDFTIVVNTTSPSIEASTSQTLAYEGNTSVTETPGVLAQAFNDTLTEATNEYGGLFTDTQYGNIWTGTFTFNGGGTLTGTSTLPSGTYTLSGTTALNNSTRAFTFVITTLQALQIDPTCTTTYHATAGVIKATATATSPASVASIIFTFNGCENPTVSFASS